MSQPILYVIYGLQGAELSLQTVQFDRRIHGAVETRSLTSKKCERDSMREWIKGLWEGEMEGGAQSEIDRSKTARDQRRIEAGDVDLSLIHI